ncbi:unnamed protein product [Eruca vesicaria subsp. sativa]|uniref:Uncharacterized protein n=1 Tax=Eruca vesicaria subsp. sativa TaxID=29727 RepID=A0ABC8LZS0_ERUVS|nr:unnamed protein product [Eruca vesicaria subsp. sativa]
MTSKEEDEHRIFDHFPRRPRSSSSSLKKPLQYFNGSSPLFDLNKIPSETTKTTNPQNLSSLSSSSSCLIENNTSRKRHAVQEGKISFKKEKVSPFFTWEGKDTPEWMVQLMRSMKGASDPMLIFEKTLFETDVEQSRNDFLTPLESRIIEEDIMSSTTTKTWVWERFLLIKALRREVQRSPLFCHCSSSHVTTLALPLLNILLEAIL